MTKDEAIELLDCLLGMIDDNQGNDYDEAFHMAIDALKEQPEPQWIPCSERLPEEDDYRSCYGYEDAVWWVNDEGLMGLGWYYTSTRTWAYYDELSCSEMRVGNVVAWMPLPEPYKEEDNG